MMDHPLADLDAKKVEQLFCDAASVAVENIPMEALLKCESPIEKLMLLALWANGSWFGRIEIRHQAQTLDDLLSRGDGGAAPCGMQIAIGDYRVDFAIVMTMGLHNPPLIVVVECDGHEFHEKTKQQVARDKARDRDLTANGARVFRFSGSEIWRDASECAKSLLSFMYSEYGDAAFREYQRTTYYQQTVGGKS